MEKLSDDLIKEYYNLDFYTKQYHKHKSPFSMIMDLSEIIPAEIEIEDEIKEYSLWKKISNYYK